MSTLPAQTGGTPLDILLDLQGPSGHGALGIAQFLRIAISVTAALGHLHSRGFVHKDIRPANVLVNTANDHAGLLGLGIAGTLPYMAPEQTGRMSRPIDSRSDLYSLGVTFYQMLTGSLPFTASDPMEWVHCHIARKPVPLDERNVDIPAPIAQIVMKLLAKTAEERYQTAGGVENDLRRCLAEWENAGRIESFAVAEHDLSDRLLIPDKIYGRKAEIEGLLNTFDRVATGGKPELVLISGYSGIGKSSVVNELGKTLALPRGWFASGKFDPYKRDIPYATLAESFQSLVRVLLGKSEVELSQWRDALHDALGPNGQLIVNLVPELQLIIGVPPPVPDLPVQDAQRRFQLVLRRFIGLFASAAHPLALFLDDLQWLDSATLDLIADLLTHSDVRHLLLIGAYRDNEVNSSHPLTEKMSAIRASGAAVQEIALRPLNCAALTELIADSLHPETESAAALAGLIHEKTAGNPFFAIQFIGALVEEGLITFDRAGRRWSWDLEHIRSRSYTDNVADLMVGKLGQLPVETQQALLLLACLGNSAELTLLERVSQQSTEAIQGRLAEAIRAGLLFRTEHSYRFLHDRVREAAYSRFPENVRAATHLRIGRLLSAHSAPEQRHEAIYEIVNQLNRGARLIDSDREREQLAELNLVAGRRAKAANAYGSALSYLTLGDALLPKESRERGHSLVFLLELNRAECEFLTGDLAAAETRLATLSSRGANLVDKAAVACLRATLYTTLDRAGRAVEVCLDYLREAGIAWSLHPADEEVREEYARLCAQLDTHPIEALFDLPLLRDPDWRATMEVLTELSAPAFFVDGNLQCLALLRMVNLSQSQGNCDGSCYAYCFMNTIMGSRFGDYRAGLRFGQLSLDLIEKKGLDRFKARVYFACGAGVFPWGRHVRSAAPLLRRALEAALQTGDQTYTAYAYCHLVSNRLTSADPVDEVLREAESALEFAQKTHFTLAVDVMLAQIGFIRGLRGLTPQLDAARFEQRLESPSHVWPACWYWIRKLQAHIYSGDPVQAVAAAAKAQTLLAVMNRLFEEGEYHYFAALARAAAADSATPEERREHCGALAEHHERLIRWAEHCPENFGNRVALVGAEIARLTGRELEAERLYEQAIRNSREHGFLQNEGLAYELAARFYAARGFEEFKILYLHRARHCYQRWGADGKVRQLVEQYPCLREAEPAMQERGIAGAPIEQLDLATVLKVSQAVSGEMILDRLLERLMRAAIEHAGAERGLLIDRRGDELHIQAQAAGSGAKITVRLDNDPSGALPQSLVRYVMRTRDPVILADAAAQNSFSTDPYLTQHRVRSVLCLPLINQGNLIAVLYLENNLAPRVFGPARIAVLKLLASQAAMSLDNTRLYYDVAAREAALRQSEAYLAESQRLTHTGSWAFNPATGSVTYWSDEMFRIYGMDSQNGAPTRDEQVRLTHPEDRARNREAIGTAIRDKAGFTLNYRHVLEDGTVKHFHSIGRPVLDPTGALVEFVGTVVDVTEQRRAELRLLVQYRVTKILADAATVAEATPKILQAMCECLEWDLGAVWRIDPRQSVLRCTEVWRKPQVEATALEAVTRTSTYPLGGGLPGRVWASRTPACIPDAHDSDVSADSAYEGLHAVFALPILLGQEVLGVMSFFSGAVWRADQNLLDMMATIGNQIGQFVKRAAAVDELQLRVSMLQHIPVAAWSVMPDGTPDIVNQLWFEYTGQTPEYVNSHPEAWMATLHPEDRQRAAASYWDGIRSGQGFAMEARFLRARDGTFRWHLNRAVPVRDPEGNIVRFVCTTTDVHDWRQAQEELRNTQAELAHTTRVLTMGELTASIAHEVNQPLGAIVTSAGACERWLAAKPPQMDKARRALERIANDGRRAGEVIKRIRALMKRRLPQKEWLMLNETIREVIAITQHQLRRNDILLETQLAEGLPLVRGDRVQLQQVLLNLIVNAIEAMSGNERHRELTIVSAADGPEAVAVEVRDTGMCFDVEPERVAHLFEPFYTTKAEGLGIGLSISRTIIEAHGGHLSATANVPHGAVFRFSVPLEEPT